VVGKVNTEEESQFLKDTNNFGITELSEEDVGVRKM